MNNVTGHAGSPALNDAYALFSAEARSLRSQIHVSSRPPVSEVKGVTIRSIELREQPFATWHRQLSAISNLPEGWDSYGAAPVTSAAIRTASALLNTLSFRPLAGVSLVPFHLAPIPTGGVQIEWKRPDGAALELWIGGDGSLEAVLDRPTSEPRITEKRYSSLGVAVAEIETFAA